MFKSEDVDQNDDVEEVLAEDSDKTTVEAATELVNN